LGWGMSAIGLFMAYLDNRVAYMSYLAL
jgi:hypothetical protein